MEYISIRDVYQLKGGKNNINVGVDEDLLVVSCICVITEEGAA